MRIFIKSYSFIYIIFILCFTGNAQAISFASGDIFAAVSGASGTGAVQHYSAAGVLLETLSTGVSGFNTGMAFDSSDNLYVTNFTAGTITRFDSTGAVIAPNPFVTNETNGMNESIVFDSAGNFYVGQAGPSTPGSPPSRDIIKRAADGSFITSYDVPIEGRGSDWLDLAADQTTMFYTSEGRQIKRYDVGTNTALADFATLPGTGIAFAFRLLGDGGLLVADNSNVKRLNSAGTVIQTYDIVGQNSWFSLNLNPDGTSFWSGNSATGRLYEFDIATGVNTQTINTGVGATRLFGVTVFRETTVGNGIVPLPASLWLFGSGLAFLIRIPRRG